MSINDQIPPNPHPVKPPPNLPPPKQVSQPKRVEYYQIGGDGMVRNHDIDYTRGIGSLFVCAADYADLAAENERLRKAGDAVCESPYLLETDPAVFAWRAAAKEGTTK